MLEDQYIANLDENDLELRLLSQRGTMNARRPVNLTEAVSAAYTCITKGFLADTCDPPNGVTQHSRRLGTLLRRVFLCVEDDNLRPW